MRVRELDAIASGEACPECGLRTASGQPTCVQMRDALLARDFEQPVRYWRFHRLAVDAYCLQHEPYVKSGKSLAAHLCGVCIALEHANDASLLERLNRWLSTNPPIKRPALPTFRGALTIAHVHGIDEPVEYGRRVEGWARSAWDAYRDLHPLGREWITLSARVR
jgi:Family of unknown function (DUF5946)